MLLEYKKQRLRSVWQPAMWLDLRWMSENLLTREMEEWSKLADEFLQDPVYQGLPALSESLQRQYMKGNSTSNLVMGQ